MTDEKRDSDEAPETTPPEAPSSVPEVEAEIVADSAATLDASIDDLASEDAPEATVVEDEAPPSPPRKSSFSPGVLIFIAFAAIVLCLFFVWRWQSHGPAPKTQSAVVEEASPPSAAAEETTAPPPPAEEEAKPEDASLSSAQPAEHQTQQHGVDIARLSNDDMRAAMNEIKEAPSETTADEGAFLPPVGADHDALTTSQALQDAAKSAAAEFAETPAPTASEEQSADAITAFEPEPVETDAADETQDVAVNDQQTDEGAAPQEPADAPATDSAPIEEDHMAAVDAPTQGAAPLPTPDAAVADKIANDVASLKQAFTAQNEELAQALADERERSASLEEEIRRMRQEFGNALAARDARAESALSSLRADLEKIQNTDDASQAQRAAATIALGSLERAVDAGRPFVSELQVIARIAPNAPAVDALRAHAAQGAPTLLTLKAGFPEAAREALAAAGQSRATGFWSRLLARAQSLVSVRPAEPTAGDSARAVMSRAEAAVVREDMAAAVDELAALPAPAQAAMGDWLEGAKARAETTAAVDQLKGLIFGPSAG